MKKTYQAADKRSAFCADPQAVPTADGLREDLAENENSRARHRNGDPAAAARQGVEKDG